MSWSSNWDKRYSFQREKYSLDTPDEMVGLSLIRGHVILTNHNISSFGLPAIIEFEQQYSFCREIKKKLQYRFYSVSFAKPLRIPFYRTPLCDYFCVGLFICFAL